MIPYGRQDISKQDIQAVVDVLRSDFITQGPKVVEFEKTVSDYVGSKYAVALNSATSALHVACLSLGLKKGDWVWTSPITFVASANCALYCNANVDFVDIDPHTYNLCTKALKAKLEVAKKEGRLPKIVIPVHFAGQSCDMSEIYALSLEYHFSIIEDASHAIGGKYESRPIGGCQYCDITIFSFHPVKIITTAEGGIATTNKLELAEKMARLRSHGITRDENSMTHPSDGGWYYQQIELGYNYRMTELQAALGVSQMSRLDTFIEKRQALAALYNQQLKSLKITLPFQRSETYSSYHLYPILVEEEKRHYIYTYLREHGIGVNVHYIPVHLQPYYQELGFSIGDFPIAESYYKRAISLPLYSELTHMDQNRVIDTLKKALK